MNATAKELYHEVVNKELDDGTFVEFGITVVEVVVTTTHYPRRDIRLFIHLQEDTIWPIEADEEKPISPRRYKRTRIVQTGDRNKHIRGAIESVDRFMHRFGIDPASSAEPYGKLILQNSPDLEGSIRDALCLILES